MKLTTSVTADLGADIMVSQRFTVDSKAMRKLPVGKTMYAVLGIVEQGTATMCWYFDSRTLFFLP